MSINDKLSALHKRIAQESVEQLKRDEKLKESIDQIADLLGKIVVQSEEDKKKEEEKLKAAKELNEKRAAAPRTAANPLGTITFHKDHELQRIGSFHDDTEPIKWTKLPYMFHCTTCSKNFSAMSDKEIEDLGYKNPDPLPEGDKCARHSQGKPAMEQ